MRNLNLFFFLVLSFMLFSCSDDALEIKNQQAKTIQTALNFGIENFIQQERDCEQETPCLRINLQYPFAQDGKIGVRNAINEYIQQIYTNSLLSNKNAKAGTVKTLHVAAKLLVDKFRNTIPNKKGDIPAWKKKSKGEILYQNTKYVSFKIPIYSKTANTQHTYTHLFGFDIERGFRIQIADLILNETAFYALCREKIIASYHNLPSKSSTKIKDFLSKERFKLPKNTAFSKEGLYCYYNAGEATPKVLEPIYFTIHYDALRKLVDLKYQ